jgi:hypothetical protein
VDQFDEEFVMGMIGAMMLSSDNLLAYLQGWTDRKAQMITSEPDPSIELGRLISDSDSSHDNPATP